MCSSVIIIFKKFKYADVYVADWVVYYNPLPVELVILNII